MTWRSVVITRPSKLRIAADALEVAQDDGAVRIPLDDIAVICLSDPRIALSAATLAHLAQRHIATITVGGNHLPNAVLLPLAPHSRGLRIVRAQMALRKPPMKRLWKAIIQQKVANQGKLLSLLGRDVAGEKLSSFARRVRSGDPDNLEAQAGRVYFQALLGRDFTRAQDVLVNHGLNYGYAVARACIGRALVAHGFFPPLGIQHHSEQNPFNLADDIIEPYRPLIDAHVALRFLPRPGDESLTVEDKANLVSLLHADVRMSGHVMDAEHASWPMLRAIEMSVVGLQGWLFDHTKPVPLPILDARWAE